MRFFHISDLHIGLKLMNKDLSEDQIYILDEIVKAVKLKKPDAIVIAGDIYDKSVPSSEAMEIFDNFISKLVVTAPDMVIMIISGNHDSAVRINQFRQVLKPYKLHFVGMPPRREGEYIEKITLNDEAGKINFFLLPFVRPSFVRNLLGIEKYEDNLSYDEALKRLFEREDINTDERNVLVSHQYYLPTGKRPEEVDRTESEIVTVGNIDMVKADLLERFDYAALGHIHKPTKVLGDFHRYSGTPLACSVSEAGQEKGIIMVEMLEKGKITTEVIPLEPLRQIRVIEGKLDEILNKSSDDYVTVILTDEDTLDIDVNDRIRDKFPNLLEIGRKTVYKNYKEGITESLEEPDELGNCKIFLDTLTLDEEKMLEGILNELKGDR